MLPASGNKYLTGGLRLRLVFTLLLLPFFCTCVRAQIDAPASTLPGGIGTLQLTAMSLTDSVRLRWAPTSYQLWKDLQRVGLYVERNTLMRGGKMLPLAERQQSRRLNLSPLKPVAEVAFGNLAGRDRYVAIGGQAIYGETFRASGGATTNETYGSILNQAKEDQNRFSFGLYAADQSWVAAKMMGLAFTDPTARRNETYLYRLVPAAPIPGYNQETSGLVTVMVNDNAPPPPVTRLKAEFGDRQVTLSWDIGAAGAFYSSYHVLRSRDGLSYRLVNQDGLPFVPLVKESQTPTAFYQDSLPQNNQPYFYKIVGNTPFGLAGQRSEPVQGMGLDAAPSAAPSLSSVFPTDAGGFAVSWTFDAAAKIAGFRVERSNSDRGEYAPVSPLLPPASRTFTDPNPLPTNYYRVTVYDQYDRPMSSYAALAQADDQEPPAVPSGLRGLILKDGRIILSWDENTEADLLGYRIWLSNQPNVEYSLATGAPIKENYYIDSTTLNTLSPRLYAKIVSLDYRHNTSVFSDFIELARPDTIPPAPPLMVSVEANQDFVTINWAFSRSLDLDKHELQWRPADREEAGEDWTLLESYNAIRTRVNGTFKTRDMPKGKRYEYRVVATDLGGLSSSSKIMVGSIIDDFVRKGVEDIQAKADRRAKAVNLSWTFEPENDQFKHFEIWRSAGNEAPLPVGRVGLEAAGSLAGRSSNRLQYMDQRQLRMNTQYQYHLKAIYADGGASRLSAPVTVNY